MNVTCGETMVASTKSVRYLLGVYLDQSLDVIKSRIKFLRKATHDSSFHRDNVTYTIFKHKLKETFGISSNSMSFQL